MRCLHSPKLHAFSLIEVVFALGLLAFVAASLWGVVGASVARLGQFREAALLTQRLGEWALYLNEPAFEAIYAAAQQGHTWLWDGQTLPPASNASEAPLYRVHLQSLYLPGLPVHLEDFEEAALPLQLSLTRAGEGPSTLSIQYPFVRLRFF